MANAKLKLPIDESVNFDIHDLNDLLETLLGENGCPWDRQQTYESLKKYLLEETYEAVEAIDSADMQGLQEELGDVLFQLMFISKLAEKENAFDFSKVINGVCRKMLSRHTHIFGSETALTSDDVGEIWERNKAKEKQQKSLGDKLKTIPSALPALMRAEKILEKTKAYAEISKGEPEYGVEYAIGLLTEANDSGTTLSEEDIGNLLLCICDISRKIQINAEFALTNTLKTYINKFENIESH